MPRQDDLRPKLLSTGNGGLKIFNFKPEQDSIAMRESGIPNRPVVMIYVPAMQLHEQLTVCNQLLVLVSAVTALASQKTLVPATARFNILNANKGLWTHGRFNFNATRPCSRIVAYKGRQGLGQVSGCGWLSMFQRLASVVLGVNIQ